MARTITEIYDAIITEKETMTSLNGLQPLADDSQTLLADLTSTSKVAIWRLLFFVTAVAIWTLENIFDQHLADVQAISDTAIAGTQLWYQKKALEWQEGDLLEVVNGVVGYSVVDESKRTVKLAAVIDGGGQVRIKVAKLTGTVTEALSASQLTSFQEYINGIKFAGTNTASTSRDADLAKLQAILVYNPLVMTSAGESILNGGTYPVEDAINGYLTGLPFNGVFRKNGLIDAVQAVEGVIDIQVNVLEAKFGALPYLTILKEYIPDAGYLKIDPLFPLSTNLTYQVSSV